MFFLKYYFKLESDTKEESEDLYCLLEHKSWKNTKYCVEWFEWPDITYSDIYNDTLLILYSWAIKGIEKPEWLNSSANLQVSDVLYKWARLLD